jgi:hypothetical protein
MVVPDVPNMKRGCGEIELILNPAVVTSIFCTVIGLEEESVKCCRKPIQKAYPSSICSKVAESQKQTLARGSISLLLCVIVGFCSKK